MHAQGKLHSVCKKDVDVICTCIYCKRIFIRGNFISQFTGDKLVCSDLFSQSTLSIWKNKIPEII